MVSYIAEWQPRGKREKGAWGRRRALRRSWARRSDPAVRRLRPSMQVAEFCAPERGDSVQPASRRFHHFNEIINHQSVIVLWSSLQIICGPSRLGRFGLFPKLFYKRGRSFKMARIPNKETWNFAPGGVTFAEGFPDYFIFQSKAIHLFMYVIQMVRL